MSVLGDYRPRSVDEACWREVRPAVEAVLAGLDPSLVHRARLPFALLAAFVHRCGYDPTVELLLDETLLAQWVTTLDNVRTAATFRSHVRQVADVHRPDRAAARTPLPRDRSCPPPYTAEQVEQMLAHAASLSTEARRVDAAALVLTGAGAGLDGRDLSGMTGAHVIAGHDGLVTVRVAGSRRPRTVAVLGRYASRLADVAGRSEALMPGRQLVGGTANSASVTERGCSLFIGWGGEPVSARRLRITWLATHLMAGTRLPVLLAQAGISSLAGLEDVAAHLAVTLDADDDVFAEAAGALP